MKRMIGLVMMVGLMVGCTGPEGPIGPQGGRGSQGQAGSAGSKGEQGEQGARGARGQAGSAGSKGEQGPIGISTGGALYVATFDSGPDLDTWYKDPSDFGSWSVNEGRLVMAGKSDRWMSIGPEIILAYDDLYARIKHADGYSPLRELEIHVQTEWLSGSDTGPYGILLEPVSVADAPRGPLPTHGMYLNGISADGHAQISVFNRTSLLSASWRISNVISPDSTDRFGGDGNWDTGIINRKGGNVLFYKLSGNNHMFDVCEYSGWRGRDTQTSSCPADIEDLLLIWRAVGDAGGELFGDDDEDGRLPIWYRANRAYYGLRMRLFVHGLQEVAFDNLYILDKPSTTQPLLKPTTE